MTTMNDSTLTHTRQLIGSMERWEVGSLRASYDDPTPTTIRHIGPDGLSELALDALLVLRDEIAEDLLLLEDRMRGREAFECSDALDRDPRTRTAFVYDDADNDEHAAPWQIEGSAAERELEEIFSGDALEWESHQPQPGRLSWEAIHQAELVNEVETSVQDVEALIAWQVLRQDMVRVHEEVALRELHQQWDWAKEVVDQFLADYELDSIPEYDSLEAFALGNGLDYMASEFADLGAALKVMDDVEATAEWIDRGRTRPAKPWSPETWRMHPKNRTPFWKDDGTWGLGSIDIDISRMTIGRMGRVKRISRRKVKGLGWADKRGWMVFADYQPLPRRKRVERAEVETAVRPESDRARWRKANPVPALIKPRTDAERQERSRIAANQFRPEPPAPPVQRSIESCRWLRKDNIA